MWSIKLVKKLCIIFRWAFVEVESKATWPDEQQAFAAGMAEGYLTKDLIYAHYRNTLEVTWLCMSLRKSLRKLIMSIVYCILLQNYCKDKQKTCDAIDKFVTKNIAWTLKSTSSQKSQNSYWYHVSLLLEQIDGLYAGYKKAANGTDLAKLTKRDLMYGIC